MEHQTPKVSQTTDGHIFDNSNMSELEIKDTIYQIRDNTLEWETFGFDKIEETVSTILNFDEERTTELSILMEELRGNKCARNIILIKFISDISKIIHYGKIEGIANIIKESLGEFTREEFTSQLIDSIKKTARIYHEAFDDWTQDHKIGSLTKYIKTLKNMNHIQRVKDGQDPEGMENRDRLQRSIDIFQHNVKKSIMNLGFLGLESGKIILIQYDAENDTFNAQHGSTPNEKFSKEKMGKNVLDNQEHYIEGSYVDELFPDDGPLRKILYEAYGKGEKIDILIPRAQV